MYTYIEGKPHTVGTEAETLEMVRGVLTEVEDNASEKPRALKFHQAAKAKSMRKARARRSAIYTPIPTDEEPAKRAFRLPTLRLPNLGLNRIKRKHVAAAALVALALIKPLWVLFAVLALVLLIAAAFYFAGGEKIWRGVMLALHNLSDTDPDRAVRIRARLDRFAVKWDTFLDRFPDGMVDGLYLPDFQVLSQDEALNEKRIAERLERLANEY